jgi:hypothetical protein
MLPVFSNACPVNEEVKAPFWANNTRNQVRQTPAAIRNTGRVAIRDNISSHEANYEQFIGHEERGALLLAVISRKVMKPSLFNRNKNINNYQVAIKGNNNRHRAIEEIHRKNVSSQE